MSYEEGIYDGCSYDSNINIDHAVMVIGYGEDASGAKYWHVQNSWGAGWGDGGFLKA